MIPAALWPILIQEAVPLGADLLQMVLNLFTKSAKAEEITDADWNALGDKWASKTAESYLNAAISRAGIK